MEEPGSALRTTPLDPLTRDLGARLVDFAGWRMPVQFSSVLEEHDAVRRAAGLFDVSHMGEVEVRGPGALALLRRATCNDPARLAPGQAQYSALLTERGTFIDDVLVYRRGADVFFLVVNAANAAKDLAWMRRLAGGEADVRDSGAGRALLALQGPRAQAILAPHTGLDLAGIGYYRFATGTVLGGPGLVSRTGYTGEDGFEIAVPAERAVDLFRALMRTGAPLGLKPCGLGARDTLRLEASMPLYGQDIDEGTTALEAGLGRFVRFDKGDFTGRDALLRQKREGVPRALVGIEMIDPGIARHGHPIRAAGETVGAITSGTYGPFVRKSIGLGYVPARLAAPGTRLAVVIRGREAAAVVVPTPFYRRPR